MDQLEIAVRAGEETALGKRRLGAGNPGGGIMGRGNFQQYWLLIRKKRMPLEVRSVFGNFANEPVAESQSFFGIGFFTKGLFENFPYECRIAGRLLFRIEFAKQRAKLRPPLQGVAEIFINKSFIKTVG